MCIQNLFNVFHSRPVPDYRISTFVFLPSNVHFSQCQTSNFQNFLGRHALEGPKNSGPSSNENFGGLNSSTYYLYHSAVPKIFIFRTLFVFISIYLSDQSDAFVAGFLYIFVSIYLSIFLCLVVGFRPRFHSAWSRPLCNCLVKKINQGTDKHTELPASSFSIMCSQTRMYEIDRW